MKKNNHPSAHNYFKPVMEFGERMPQGSSWLITVSHENWCGVFEQGLCNCEPQISGKQMYSEGDDD